MNSKSVSFSMFSNALRWLLLVNIVWNGVTGSRLLREAEICDNGKLNVDQDFGSESNWICPSDSTFTKDSYHKPSSVPTCNITIEYEPTFRCMDETLEYSAHPPTIGDYRPVAPVYGDYEYLPPQRWLHALKLGGVAFLYHPCAPTDQVVVLKHLARSCLWKHVISPYPHLSRDKPLALVSWGCMYPMEWVHHDSVKAWLRQNALKTDQSSVLTTGTYNEKLITEADSDLIQQAICPDRDSSSSNSNSEDLDSTSTNTHSPEISTKTNQTITESPCSAHSVDGNSEPITAGSSDDNPNCNGNRPTTLIVVDVSYRRLTILISFAVVILLFAVLIVLWRLWSTCSRRQQTRGRYKSVSKYFPLAMTGGSKGEERVSIPEMGIPKNGFSEREKLLDESDEDEL